MPRLSATSSKLLARDGYVHVRGAVAVSPQALASAQRIAARKAGRIFNGARNDGKRRQARVDSVRRDALGDVMRAVEGAASSVVNVDSTEWVVLQSLAGCAEQDAHTDYELDDPLLQRAWRSGVGMPHFGVVALEPGTRLVVWRGSHRVAPPLVAASLSTAAGGKRPRGVHDDAAATAAVERVELELAVGDALIVRGDTVHAGAAYGIDNVRVHAFLDSAAVPRKPNKTYRLARVLPPDLFAASLGGSDAGQRAPLQSPKTRRQRAVALS